MDTHTHGSKVPFHFSTLGLSGFSGVHIISIAGSVNKELFPKLLGLVTPSPLRVAHVDSALFKQKEL